MVESRRQMMIFMKSNVYFFPLSGKSSSQQRSQAGRAVLEKLWEEYDHNPFEFKVAHYVQFINWSLVELEKAFPRFLPIFKYQKDGSIKIFHMPISEDLLFHERAKYYGFHIYAHKKVCLKHYDVDWTFYSVEDEDDVDDCNDDL